jgi:hypothetical protein
VETNLDKIRAYYASFDGWGRLDGPEGVRELTRALEILVDRLAPGARVLDLGGGPGRQARAGCTRPRPRWRSGALYDRAGEPRPSRGAGAAADTGTFSNPTTTGFHEGYYPLPSEIEQLFVASGFRFEDMLSLKSIANDLAPQVARLEPTVRAEAERLARALCRRPEIIATCGHALLVARESP